MSESKRVSRWSMFFACCLCLVAAPYAIAGGHDECTGAIEVACGDTISGSTASATFDDTGFCGTSNTAPGVWYKVTHTGLITASTCDAANYDTKISVFEGDCGALGCVAGNDDAAGCSGFTSEVSWSSDGTESLILVHGFSSGTGDFDLTITCSDTADNDVCEDAIEINCGDTISGSTTTASLDDAGTCGTSNTAPGVWYKISHDGLITASTCNAADYDTKISVYGDSCGALGCVAGNDDTSGCGITTEMTWGSDGSESLILVHGFSSQTGNFDLTMTCGEVAENDVCEDAIGPLAVGSVTAGSTAFATLDEPPSLDCGTAVTAPGVWYTVTGTGNTMTASTCNDGNPSTGGADFDTKISVYCDDCEDLECIGGQDDDASNCSGFSTNFSWPTNAGQTYNVLVHGFSGNTGDFDLAIQDDGVPATGANDCDGIAEEFDFCPGTVIPESVPTIGQLLVNRWALVTDDGDFDTVLALGGGPDESFTLVDTAGCSCEQIIDQFDLGPGQSKFGCARAHMQAWEKFLADASCGNCVEAHGGIGCEVAACEATICDFDPFCCDVTWDFICALDAAAFCVPDSCIVLPSSPEFSAIESSRRVLPEDPLSKLPVLPKEE